MLWNKEPVMILMAVRAVILCAVTFGLSWSAEQIAAVMVALEMVLGLVTRSRVSPVSGEPTVKPRIGLWLPLLLAGSLSVSACGGLTIPPNTPAPANPAPTEEQVQATRAKAVQIAGAVEKIGELVVQVQKATGEAYATGLITQEQRDVVYQGIIDLEPQAIALIDIAQTVTTDPQLRTTVTALMDVVDRLLVSLTTSGSETLRRLSDAIRVGLDVARLYLMQSGGGL